MRHRSFSKRHLFLAVGLSLVGHLVTGTFLVLSGLFITSVGRAIPLLMNNPSSPDAEPMQIETLLTELTQPIEPNAKEVAAQKEREEKRPDGQVVDVAPPLLEQRPDAARFLAEHDVATQREVRGPVGTDRPFVAPSVPAPGQRETLPGVPQPVQNRLVTLRGPTGDKLPGPTQTESGHERLSLGPDGTMLHGQDQTTGGRVGAAALPGNGPLRLSPRLESLGLSPGSGSPDYLGDLDEADSTSLNARKWKFAGFFNRLKQQIREEWHPDEVLARHDPSGNIYGNRARVTLLKVELTLEGRVAEVSLVKSSGVDFLDDEAMSAVRRAQPFANPPEPMADADKVIRFRFGFVIENAGFKSLHLHKY